MPSRRSSPAPRGSARRARSRRARRRAGRILAVENRVHLDHLERARDARLGHELEREVGLAVGEPAAHRRPNAGRHLRVERVHVEADVDEPGPGDVRERLANRAIDADPIDVAHRVDLRVELVEKVALALVEPAHPHERDTADLDRRQRPGAALKRRPRETERCSEGHPVHVAAWRRLRPVEIAVRPQPRRCPSRRTSARAPESALRAPRSGSRTGPCPLPAGRRRGRGSRRSRRRAAGLPGLASAQG